MGEKNTINMIFFRRNTDFQFRKLLFYGVNKCISTHTLFRGYFLINDVTEKDLQQNFFMASEKIIIIMMWFLLVMTMVSGFGRILQSKCLDLGTLEKYESDLAKSCKKSPKNPISGTRSITTFLLILGTCTSLKNMLLIEQ